MWLAQNLLPEVPIYNLAVALHLEGEIDLDYLCRAFRVLVDSSDALCTIVEERDGIPMQRILSQAPAMIDFQDFSQHPEAETRARTLMAVRCEASTTRGCNIVSVLTRIYLKWLSTGVH